MESPRFLDEEVPRLVALAQRKRDADAPSLASGFFSPRPAEASPDTAPPGGPAPLDVSMVHSKPNGAHGDVWEP